MSNDTITITGLVATTPRLITTGEGLTITSFRLASTQRRFDKDTEKWIDGETNWFTFTSFRHLATNVAHSVSRGERVVVNGTLRIREWDNGERAGTTVEVEAATIGHDPEYVVGTATTARLLRNAIALPTPMVEPPPTVTQASTPSAPAIASASSTTLAGTCISAPEKIPAARDPNRSDTCLPRSVRPGVVTTNTPADLEFVKNLAQAREGPLAETYLHGKCRVGKLHGQSLERGAHAHQFG